MKTKKIIGLAVAAVILGGVAYISSNSKKVNTPSDAGKLVLPHLDLSKIQQIELSKKSGDKLVLKSAESGWTIASLYNYPADITKIRENLLTLKDMKVGQNAPASKIANAALLDLQDESGKSLITLRIGDQHSRKATGQMAMYGGGSYPDGRYLSTGDSEKVYLVKETLSSITTTPANWADTEIVSLISSDINGIAVIQGDDAVILSKKDGSWTLAGLKEGEEFDTSKSYALESSLRDLTFNTLADPSMSDDQLGITTGTVFKVTMNNGESYTAAIGNCISGSSDRYMKIQASCTPSGTNTTVSLEIKTKIANFNEKTAKWSYVISAQKAENMIKSRSDLIKEKIEPPKVKDPEEAK